MANLLDVPPLDGLNAPQGLISPHIIVAASERESDEGLVYAVVDYVNRVQQEARLMPGEYPEEASWAYCADYYLAQVNNGGHGQYAHNSGMLPRGLRDCRRGLEAMGASENLAIFDAFLAIMAADDDRARGIREGSGFGDIDPEIDALDDRFFKLGYRILELNAAWLRTLPILAPTPQAEMAAAFAALREKNPLAQAREDAANAAKAKFESEDETYSAAHACCAQEGIAFERLTAGSHIGDVGINWGMITSGGLRYLRVIGGELADMRDDKGALKALHFYETRGPYRERVGDGAVRADVLKRTRLPAPMPLGDVAKFLSPPLINFCFVAAPDPGARATLVSVAHVGAEHFQYVPRAAWSGYSRDQEHADFRLVAANTLWDLSTREIHATHPDVLNQDHTAQAAFAAAGALAAAAGASVRLLSARQLAALKQDSAEDLAREQANVTQQLLEIRTWWYSALRRLGLDIENRPVAKNVFLRPSALKLAADVILKSDGPIERLEKTMAYFDREYAPLSLPLRVVAKAALNRIESVQGYALVPMVHAFRSGAAKAAPTLDFAATYSIAPPSSVGGKSKNALMAVLSITDVASGSHQGAIGFDIDNRGKRRTYKPKG